MSATTSTDWHALGGLLRMAGEKNTEVLNFKGLKGGGKSRLLMVRRKGVRETSFAALISTSKDQVKSLKVTGSRLATAVQVIRDGKPAFEIIINPEKKKVRSESGFESQDAFATTYGKELSLSKR